MAAIENVAAAVAAPLEPATPALVPVETMDGSLMRNSHRSGSQAARGDSVLRLASSSTTSTTKSTRALRVSVEGGSERSAAARSTMAVGDSRPDECDASIEVKADVGEEEDDCGGAIESMHARAC